MLIDICDKRQSILDGKGSLLVTGGPGSGKTTIALYKAKKFINESRDVSQRVLFLSFSKSAVAQILQKSQTLLSTEEKRRIDIRTYHSFFLEILKSHGYLLSSRRILSVILPQKEKVMKEGSNDWDKEVERLFLSEGKICFNLFAPKVQELFQNSNSLRKIYSSAFPLIIVDEFQDTNEPQWEVVLSLSKDSQILCLADPNQLIYSWRPGVNPKRVNFFKEKISSKVIDFGTENNRSPNNKILNFADNMLQDNPLLSCEEVTICRYYSSQFNIFLKLSVLKILRKLKESGIKNPSIAVMSRTNLLISRVSAELDKPSKVDERNIKPINHTVVIDENRTLLSSEIISLMLEIDTEDNLKLVTLLQAISDFYVSFGNATGSKKVGQISGWIKKVKTGELPSQPKLPKGLVGMLKDIKDNGFTGNPYEDWSKILHLFKESNIQELKDIEKSAKNLKFLKRRTEIHKLLENLWRNNKSYLGARESFNKAISIQQIQDDFIEEKGITLMSMHKSKGKEFDAVILVADKYQSTFNLKDESIKCINSRRLLRVAITRARHHVHFLVPHQCWPFEG